MWRQDLSSKEFYGQGMPWESLYLNRWGKRRHNPQKIEYIWLICNLVANATQQNE